MTNVTCKRLLPAIAMVLAILCDTVFAQTENTSTTIQVGKVNISRTYQCGDSNDNTTYQTGKINISRTIQRCGNNRNETAQFGKINRNQTVQSGFQQSSYKRRDGSNKHGGSKHRRDSDGDVD